MHVSKKEFYTTLGCLETVMEATRVQEAKLAAMREIVGREIYEEVSDVGYQYGGSEYKVDLEHELLVRLKARGHTVEGME